MKTVVSLVILLAIFLGVALLLLRFFSRLVDIDMIAAFIWGFRAGKLEIVLPLMLLYSIAFSMLPALLARSLNMSTVRATEKGGLAGYQDDDRMYVYYSPDERSYIKVRYYTTPPPVQKFDETFRVVSLYKPLFAGHYENAAAGGLAVSLLLIFFFLIGAVPMYLGPRVLAVDYADSGGLSLDLSHRMISDRFRGLVQASPLAVFGVAAIVVVAASLVTAYVSSSVIRSHEERYERVGDAYRRMLIDKVSLEPLVLGRVIRRGEWKVTEYVSDDSNPDDMHRRSSKLHVLPLYTIEFPRIISIPVYLDLILLGEAESNPDIRRLDSLFVDKKASMPRSESELLFRVHDDTSISLVDSGKNQANE